MDSSPLQHGFRAFSLLPLRTYRSFSLCDTLLPKGRQQQEKEIFQTHFYVALRKIFDTFTKSQTKADLY